MWRKKIWILLQDCSLSINEHTIHDFPRPLKILRSSWQTPRSLFIIDDYDLCWWPTQLFHSRNIYHIRLLVNIRPFSYSTTKRFQRCPWNAQITQKSFEKAGEPFTSPSSQKLYTTFNSRRVSTLFRLSPTEHFHNSPNFPNYAQNSVIIQRWSYDNRKKCTTSLLSESPCMIPMVVVTQ